MVQSSTDPWVVVIAGGLLGLNIIGVAPTTVMKNSVLNQNLGLRESRLSSEKYSSRLVVTWASASPSKRCGPGGPVTAGILICAAASASSWEDLRFVRIASGRCGSMSPIAPVSTLRVRNV